MKIQDKIKEISAIYSLETPDVIEALRIATKQSIKLRELEDLVAYYEGEKIVFAIQNLRKRAVEMGSGATELDCSRTVDITKDPKLYEKIVKKFQERLDEASTNSSLIKVSDLINYGEGICTGTISKVTNNGFFVKTPYGPAFCPIKYHVLKESTIGLYKVGRELDFSIQRVQIKDSKLHIVLARNTEKLANFMIRKNFSSESVLFKVKRKCGVFTKIYHDYRTVPSEQMLKKLRYMFGGEKIVCVPVGSAS